MTPNDILTIAGGGGILGFLVYLAALLIKQVSHAGEISDSQSSHWEKLVITSQGAAARSSEEATATRADLVVAKAVVAGLTAEIERLEVELASQKTTSRWEIEQLRTQLDECRARRAVLEAELARYREADA